MKTWTPFWCGNEILNLFHENLILRKRKIRKNLFTVFSKTELRKDEEVFNENIPLVKSLWLTFHSHFLLNFQWKSWKLARILGQLQICFVRKLFNNKSAKKKNYLKSLVSGSTAAWVSGYWNTNKELRKFWRHAWRVQTIV